MTAGGLLVADLVWMLASVAGVTALLVASEPAFAALRIAGAVYLTWLAHVRVQRLLLRCAGLALIAVGLRVATEPAP